MGENMCQFRFSPKEIKYCSENNVTFDFFYNFLCLHFFFQFLLFLV
jgi:hypothetical protein